ncbi:MAG: hypothetical protein P4L51_23495 [Puia sp.]|nr:hypothetical protein [Puia sp.]
MLKSISWNSFLVVVAILAGIYYTVVLFLFFRGNVKTLFSKPRLKLAAKKDASPNGKSDPLKEDGKLEDGFKLAATVSENLKAVIHKTMADGIERPDMIESLRTHLQQYLHLRGTNYATAITNTVQRELTGHGQPLNKAEIESIWKAQ